MMEPREVARLAVEALDAKNAQDIKVLKTEELTVLANYFVICTATSSTHIKTLADEVEHVLESHAEPPRRKEGARAGGWVLIDFGCVVVHIFLQESREFYNLERLWGDAEVVELR